MIRVIQTISLIIWQKLMPFFYFLSWFFKDLVFVLIFFSVLLSLMFACCIKTG